MIPPRTPVVLGIGPGVGATTLATALHAHDGGPNDTAADVVVCAGTEESLRRAEALALGPARPLLAVVLVGSAAAPPRARLRLAGRRFAAVALLPHVEAWAGLTGPPVDVATLLAQRSEHLPSAHRGYAAAVRAIAARLLQAGLLDRPRPPVVARAVRGARPPTDSRPVSRPAPPPSLPPAPPPPRRVVRPVRQPGVDDLDDEALEHAAALSGAR